MPLHSFKFPIHEQTPEDVVQGKEHENTKPQKKNIKTKHQKKNKKQKHQKNNTVNNIVTMFSANAAGCVTKTQSLMDNIKKLDAAIITLQETHFVKKGKLSEKLE